MADETIEFKMVAKDLATNKVRDFKGEINGLDKGFGKLKTSTVAVGAALGTLAANAIANAASAVKNFIGDSVSAASDLEETTSKVGVLFGESAAEIEKWAKTASETFGQSRTQAMDAASTFAIFGKSAGLAGDELVGFSTEMVELASDMASFHNASPEEAIVAIGAALRGESEPIRRFGVLLDDATLRAKALELGIIDNIKNALTPQQRALAAHAAIMEQTADAQGDFARTSDGLANTQRALAAQMDDVSASLGELLLPLVLQFARFAGDTLVPALRSFITTLGESDGFIARTAATIQSVIGAIAAWVSQNQPLLDQVRGLATAGFGVFVDVVRALAEVAAGIAGKIGQWVTAQQPLLTQLAVLTSSSIITGLQLLAQGLMWLGSQEVTLAIGAITTLVIAFKIALDALVRHPVIGGLALIATAIGTLATAWEEDWLGMREVVRDAYNTIQPALDGLYVGFQFLALRLDAVAKLIGASVQGFVAVMLRSIEKFLEAAATALRLTAPQLADELDVIAGKFHDWADEAGMTSREFEQDFDDALAAIEGSTLQHLPRMSATFHEHMNSASMAAYTASVNIPRHFDIAAGQAYRSGASISQMVANGISDYAWRAINAAANLSHQIGGYLPRSEPRNPRSGLRGISHVGERIVEMVAGGIRSHIGMVSSPMQALTSALFPHAPGVSFGAGAGAVMGPPHFAAAAAGRGVVIQFNSALPITPAQSQEVARAIIPELTRELDRQRLR